MSRASIARLLTGSAVIAAALLGIGARPVLADQSGQGPSLTPSPAPSPSPSPSPSALMLPTPAPTPSPAPNPGRSAWPTPSGDGAVQVRELPGDAAGGATGEKSVRQAEQAAPVAIVDDEFRPSELTVTAGTTVVWTNQGQHSHTVTANDRAFDSGTLEGGQTFSVTFDEVGRVPYYCQIHGEPGSGMNGVVIVQAAPEEEAVQESPASGSDVLARTGLDPTPLGIAALGLAIVGLVALRLGRTSTDERR